MKESFDLIGKAQRSYGARLRVWENTQRERENPKSRLFGRFFTWTKSSSDTLPCNSSSLSRARSSPWYLTYFKPSLIPCFFFFPVPFVFLRNKISFLRGLAIHGFSFYGVWQSGRKETVLDLAKFVDRGVSVKLSGGRQGENGASPSSLHSISLEGWRRLWFYANWFQCSLHFIIFGFSANLLLVVCRFSISCSDSRLYVCLYVDGRWWTGFCCHTW